MTLTETGFSPQTVKVSILEQKDKGITLIPELEVKVETVDKFT